MSFPRLRLPASGWKRWLALLGLSAGILILLLVLLVSGAVVALQSPSVQRWIFEKSLAWDSPTAAELNSEPAAKPSYHGPVGEGSSLSSATEIYRPDRFWNVGLFFSGPEWSAIQHQRVTPVENWMSSTDGSVKLRNPQALRNGLAGVLGLDLPWSTGRVSLGGVVFTNTAVRFKGNGSYLGAMRSYRKPFKLHLSKYQKGQHWAGRSQFSLGNLSADLTCLSDTLGYEFFREAGVPAPRTAFARVFLNIEGVETNRLLGMYVMVENPDADWARDQFGLPDVALFKPVTYELFADLGTEWSAYDGIYDPKTPISPAQQERVMELARFVTHASEAEFAGRIGEWFDLEAVARFLASEVLLSNYDGFLSNGQNFLLYLEPRSNRFGFIPWDLDHSWGEFPFVGTADQRERASIWHPWIGRHRFLERLFEVEAFKERYRQELERLLGTLFVPDRLNRRIDVLAESVRPVVAEWSADRLAQFELATSANWSVGLREGNPSDPNRPVWQLKRFIATRAENVRQQLDGKVEGVLLQRQRPW